MTIRPDQELVTVLEAATDTQLQRLAKICCLTDRPQSRKSLIDDIIVHLQHFGGTPSKNLRDGHGTLYSDILTKVVKKKDIKTVDHTADSVETKEWKFLIQVLPEAEMSPLSEVTNQVDKKISEDLKHPDEDTLKRYIPEYKLTLDNHIRKYGRDVIDGKKNPGSFAIEFVLKSAFHKGGAPAIDKIQKPLYDVVEPAVLYISFLRIGQKAKKVAHEIGG